MVSSRPVISMKKQSLLKKILFGQVFVFSLFVSATLFGAEQDEVLAADCTSIPMTGAWT